MLQQACWLQALRLRRPSKRSPHFTAAALCTKPHEGAAVLGTLPIYLHIQTQKLSDDERSHQNPGKAHCTPGKPVHLRKRGKDLKSYLIWIIFIFKLSVLVCVLVSGYVQMREDSYRCQKRESDFPSTRIIGGWELPNLGARNGTGVQCKISKYFF